MNKVPQQVGKAEVDKLEHILGTEWVTLQLDAYRDFRDNYSPADLWSHKLPSVSPIIPLLFYFHYPEYRGEQRSFSALDYWLGNRPLTILATIVGYVFFFEGYWSGLPSNLGRDNIRYKLCSAGQFDGFYHELLAAGHYVQADEYEGYTVEPIFFDPRTSRGKPDIVLYRGNEQIDIQCKARSPLDALDLPFDKFFYLFGRLCRFVQDSWQSYWVLVFPKHKLHDEDIERLISLLERAVANSLDITR